MDDATRLAAWITTHWTAVDAYAAEHGVDATEMSPTDLAHLARQMIAEQA